MGKRWRERNLKPVNSGFAAGAGCVSAHGLSAHAGVRCRAHQGKELERLCRHITHPAIANERLKRMGVEISRRCYT